MRALVADESIVSLMTPSRRESLVVVPRERRRRHGSWSALEADRVVDTLSSAGPQAVVLVRGVEVDPGAGVLGALGRLMGNPVVRLPADPAVAAWALGVAAHPQFEERLIVRRLEALVGVASSSDALPRRPIGSTDTEVPVLRPAVLSRWAGCAWRACRHCSGGGPVGGRCGRCGAPDLTVVR